MSFADWYREGERVLRGASPLDYLSEGGYCEPLTGGGDLPYADHEPEQLELGEMEAGS